MRGTLKYGVPIAAGLGVGGYALSQGEDPGSAALAAGAGALGAGGGLLGARQLAGRFAEPIAKAINTGREGAVRGLTTASQNIYAPLKTSAREVTAEEAAKVAAINAQRAQRAGSSKRAAALGGLAGTLQGLPSVTNAGIETGLKQGLGAIAAPTAALTAGLGGVALGAIPGAMGLPGFQQGEAVDPEAYGSSNSPGARYKAPTMQYV